MRKQYHFRPSGEGFYAWDVGRLIEKSRGLPPEQVDLRDIRELDENYWYGGNGDLPTCRSIVEHMKLVLEADLSYPVILSPDGRVMDGMHRIAKALLEGKRSIRAVRFMEEPEPDYVDVQPHDLAY